MSRRKLVNRFAAVAALGLLVLLGSARSLHAASAPAASAGRAAYPLHVSANKRYLVDRNGTPFLIVGDSPQGMMARLTLKQADAYFADREEHGFNTAGWIDVICAGGDCEWNKTAETVNGIRPFTGFVHGGTDYEHYDLSKPNEAYFKRLDTVVKFAAKHGIFVFLNPDATNGWIPTLRNNGIPAAYAYGQYLGRRYRQYNNVAWLNGVDYFTWKDPKNDPFVMAVARGIKSEAPNQLQTLEIAPSPDAGSSLKDHKWASIISLNGTYTYSPSYMQMLTSYNMQPTMPTFQLESRYEFEPLGKPNDPNYGSLRVLRLQEYWTMLSGGKGVFYGNHYIWTFDPGWQQHFDTPGVTGLMIWKRFFTSLPWQNLVPDQARKIVTSGLGVYGTYKTPISKGDFCTAAATPGGRYVVAYMPTVRTITVNMAALSGPAIARWFDPTDGAYTQAASGRIANKGEHSFTPPGKNHAGDGDWVLLLEASPER